MVKQILGTLLSREPESTPSEPPALPLIERLLQSTSEYEAAVLRLNSLSDEFASKRLVISPEEYSKLESSVKQQSLIVEECKQKKDQLEADFGFQEAKRLKAEADAAAAQKKAELQAEITLTSAKIEQLHQSMVNTGIEINRQKVKLNQLLSENARLA